MMIQITELRTADLAHKPPHYSGSTCIAGRMQPYTVWHKGRIWRFTKTESEARRAAEMAKIGRQ